MNPKGEKVSRLTDALVDTATNMNESGHYEGCRLRKDHEAPSWQKAAEECQAGFGRRDSLDP